MAGSASMKAKILKILIVDDDPVDRDILKQYLKSEPNGSFSFADASTGRQGLETFRGFEPDCVLLDFNLPDMNGIELITATT